jgi:hypothetical protein
MLEQIFIDAKVRRSHRPGRPVPGAPYSLIGGFILQT